MNQDLYLEAIVVRGLSDLLSKTELGAAFQVEPYPDLFSALERFIPHLLSFRYSLWDSESLDGLYTVIARKLDSETAEFAGMCILLSDQTLTPFFVRLTLTAQHDCISTYQVFVGESGGGRLGILGPLCHSDRASKILANVGARLDNIKWVYKAEKIA